MIKFFFEHGRGGRGCYGQGLCQKKWGVLSFWQMFAKERIGSVWVEMYYLKS